METLSCKELIEKYLRDALTPDESKAFAKWLHESAELQTWWNEGLAGADAEMDQGEQHQLFERIQNKISPSPLAASCPDSVSSTKSSCYPDSVSRNKSSRGFTFRGGLLRWAAIICLPLLAIFSAYYGASIARKTPARLFEVCAGGGEKASVILPDGSQVRLNALSRLQCGAGFGAKDRRVRFSGEAFFTVSPDKGHPFVIETDEVEIRVFGTSFNLSSYADDRDITIVLFEGEIGLFTPDTVYRLKPDEKIIYDKSTREAATSRVYPEDYIAWTQGQLYFDNQTFETIAKTLERTYRTPIRIESDRLKKERFTGTIKGNGIQDVLKILQRTVSFSQQQVDSVLVLTEK